jgi:Phage integrase, N-terminal SAM-like domain
MRGDWINPDAGLVSFADYARAWVAERPNLRPKTIQLYEGLVRLHLLPLLGELVIQDITEPRVRRWRKQLLDAGVGAVTVAKAYRLLKAILNTAVDDGLIRRNPCRIQGAGQEKSPERPVLTLRQVFDLADAIGPRFRLLILLAVFCGLRWGELAALRRRHIDMAAGVIRVEASMAELIDGSLVIGPPKRPRGFVLSPSRQSSSRMSSFTWTFTPALIPTALSSPAPRTRRCAAVTSPRSGGGLPLRPVLSASTFTICAMRATSWPPAPARACVNSWTGWAIARPRPHSSTSTAAPSATVTSPTRSAS